MRDRTLAATMPDDFRLYDDTAAYKYADIEVVAEHSPTVDGDNYQPWPGTHRNVWYWVELDNGKAVGLNENPSRGWSFPVINMKRNR